MLAIFGDKWHKLFGKFDLVKLLDNLDVAEDIKSNKKFNLKQLRPENFKQRLAQNALRDYKAFDK